MDLLQKDGEKELSTWVKPLKALGHSGSTGRYLWSFLPLATCDH